ncbi:myosin VIIa [Paragonimus westermani]|uniref:Myosin VIIa n=1 Tax=Paragonimus westermani TaxID=34504 RepID=A0A5J4NJB1_9TREM|nr:myosin VIIa [Paragonimus westermani]
MNHKLLHISQNLHLLDLAINNLLSFKYGDLIILRRQKRLWTPERASDDSTISLVCEPMSPLPFLHEHLIQLGDDSGWCFGQNQHTREMGEFPAKYVYVLPCLAYPTQETLDLFMEPSPADPNSNESEVKNQRSSQSNTIAESGTYLPRLVYNATQLPKTPSAPTTKRYSLKLILRQHQHTLEDFAAMYFRPCTVRPLGTAACALWSHGYEPLREPLLQKLACAKEPDKRTALAAFLAILRYMGDVPPNQITKPTSDGCCRLTDPIFQPLIASDLLRDEIYCQLVKQLTRNPNRRSIKRGWELMWLATGLVAPSALLLKEIDAILLSTPYELGRLCYIRLQRTKRQRQRLFPPHELEVTSIQRDMITIIQKVHFPDDSHITCNVASGTKTNDICSDICTQLRLRNSRGFSLYAKIGKQLHSIPEDAYFFDFIRAITDWVREKRGVNEGVYVQPVYQLFFIQKLWIDIVPGEDPKADQLFHFPQANFWNFSSNCSIENHLYSNNTHTNFLKELVRFSRGYHHVSAEKAMELGALALVSNGQRVLESVAIMDSIVPRNLRSTLTDEQWLTGISRVLRSMKKFTKDEARLMFLLLIHELPTFGSTFFEVTQNRNPGFPDRILLGVNQAGILVIDAKSRKLLARIAFGDLANWSYNKTSISFTIGNLVSCVVLDCETHQVSFECSHVNRS